MKRKAALVCPRLDIDRLLYRKPGYQIRRLQQMAVSIFLEETADFDITPVQYATLAAVSVFPGIDQLRVANAIGFDRTTISGVIDRLESKRLLVRKTSESDRRAKTLFTTEEGTQLLADIDVSTNRVQDRILEPLSIARSEKPSLDLISLSSRAPGVSKTAWRNGLLAWKMCRWA